ncbi:MAG: PAS domain S-box protein [Cyanobacteria bacterium P01_D01_bin.156]
MPLRPKHVLNSLKNLSLRNLLLIAFAGQLLGVVSLVGYLSLRNSQQTVETLAVQIRQELTSRIERELQSYFETPHEINRLNAAAFSRGELDITNAQFGEAQIYQQMKISPNVAFAYCGSSRRGEFFGVLRLPEDGSLQLSYSNRANKFLRDYFSLDVAGLRTFRLPQSTKPYDARQRPWYRAAVSAQGPAWTDVYIAFTTGLPNVTASLPVYDRTGQQLIGVCATDVVLPEEFRNFLSSLKIGNRGQAFVLDRNGNLIANSNDEPLMVGEGDQVRSLQVMESQDPLVQGAGIYLQNTFGDFARISRPQRRSFQLNGERQFIDVVPFSDGFGLDWLIVAVVPKVDFMGQIYANTRTTLLLALAGLLVAIALAILAARSLTRPVSEVCQAAEGIAEGNLEQRVTPAPIREMRRLARTFNSMAQQLQSSFQDLRIAEEKYRSIYENALEGIFQSSQEGHFISVNPAMAQLYGYSSPANMVTSIENIAKQIYVDPEGRDTFTRLLDETGEVKDFEYRSYRQDGSIIWVEENTRAVRDNTGEILYFEGIVKDITERKLREIELQRQLKELQIEIDETQKAQDVAKITESSYFQELQSEINQIDVDNFWG